MRRFCAAVRTLFCTSLLLAICNISQHCGSTILIEIKWDKCFRSHHYPALCLMVGSHFCSTCWRLTMLLGAAAMVVEDADADPRFATATSETPSGENQEPQKAASGDELFWCFWWCWPCWRSCMLYSGAIASAEVTASLEGWQHFVEGQTEVAIEEFTRAIALGQDLPVAYNHRGIAHEVLEQMVEAQADYSLADRLPEKDLELRQRLQSVWVRKPISWKRRKEPAAATEEGTDFLISFLQKEIRKLVTKKATVAWDSWKKEFSFKDIVVAGLKTCGSHGTNADFEWDSSCFFQDLFHWWWQKTCPPRCFDLLLVAGSFSGGFRARCAAPLAVSLHWAFREHNASQYIPHNNRCIYSVYIHTITYHHIISYTIVTILACDDLESSSFGNRNLRLCDLLPRPVPGREAALHHGGFACRWPQRTSTGGIPRVVPEIRPMGTADEAWPNWARSLK